ncbi:MAG: response regulator transcription factor [Bacteroidales bacterium]|nr:response regulator transcription factor [Bacteroidales bacterium]
MKERPKILYVEDDLTLSFVTRDNLAMKGYAIDAVDNGKEAIERFGKNRYDLCILDIMLPKMDGFTLAEKIREMDVEIPIIFVTARSSKEDKIRGLRLGGDDYITKPYSMEELVLKIEVFLKRRTIQRPDDQTSCKEVNQLVSWDPVNLILTIDSQKHALTHREAELFSFLYKNRDKVVKREDLLIALWGHDHFFFSRSLDVFISRLRKHLRNSGVEIENVYNVGYRLNVS